MSQPSAIRHINQARLLGALLAHGPMTRAELARALDMMRSTAGNLASALLSEGMLADDVGAAPRGGEVGRPGTRLDLNPRHSFFCGADIGVGYLRLVLIDLKAGRAGARLWQGGVRLSPAAAAEKLAELLPGLLDEARVPPGALRGLCIAVPGLTDTEGRVRRAPILGWTDVPILDLVRQRLPDLATVIAENDANAFAVAEMHRLRASGLKNALFLWLDAGVGGAILAGGRVIRGEHGFAGEFGHIYVGEDAPSGAAPLPGTLEGLVGRDALLMRHRALGGAAADIGEFRAAAARGEAPARATLAVWARALARGIADLTSVLNPAKVVLGGRVAPVFLDCASEVQAAVGSALLPGTPIPEIEVSPIGADAAALGSALLLHRTFLEIDEDLVFGTVAPPGR
jgi:predicted NBD/HSP70 family sugar kinase